MSNTTQTEADPLSARKLTGLFLLAIALVILPSLMTDKRISLKPVEVSLELHAIEESVEAVSLKEVTPNTDIAEPVPEAPQAPVQPEVVQTPPPAPEPEPEPVKPAPTPVSGTQADWLTQSGIPQDQWVYVDYILSKESGWCPTKWNGQRDCPAVPRESKLPGASSAYGLCQTMLSIHPVSATFKTNAVEQLNWCNDYAVRRYGSWQKAHSFWSSNKWW